jgi:flagellar basal-body rod protein FlgF
MIKGIYSSASGMLPRLKSQEVLANNLANSSSPGFKKERVFLKTLTEAQKKLLPQSSDWEEPMIDDIFTDFEQGMLEQTENMFNLAIEGDGFLVVSDGENEKYTRNGDLLLSPEGFLVTPTGEKVMGDSGPIMIQGTELNIAPTGEITVDNVSAGKLQVVDFPKPYELKKVGEGLFAPKKEGVSPLPAKDFSLRQGFLEQSNVNPIDEMVDMIASFRYFESAQKSIQMQDQTLEKLIEQVGNIK